MSMLIVHHKDCPKCHGTGSYMEGHVSEGVWKGAMVIYCNCFKHLPAPGSTVKESE